MNNIPFEHWGAVDQTDHQRMAKDPTTTPMVYRLMHAAVGWSNLIGHAEFGPGELGAVLLRPHKQTRRLAAPTSNHLRNEIDRAVRRGLLGVGSSEHCLIAPPWFHKGGGTGGRYCAHHGIRPARRRRSRR